MNKFWLWMIEKGYATKEDVSDDYDEHQYKWCYMMEGVDKMEKIAPTKLMLIGYMEEYLLIVYGIGVGNRSDIYIEMDSGKTYGDIRYEQLEREIMSKEDL